MNSSKLFETMQQAKTFGKEILQYTIRGETRERLLLSSFYRFTNQPKNATIHNLIHSENFIQYIAKIKHKFAKPRMIHTSDDKWIVFWTNQSKRTSRTKSSTTKPRFKSVVTPMTESATKTTTLTSIKTEDVGKQFEKAVCIAFNTAFNGQYKYEDDLPMKLKTRLEKIRDYFPMCYHSASKHGRYDFTSVTNPDIHLSVKTTKSGIGKVAPQVIGQPKPTKFCEILGIEYNDNDALKEYIQKNHTSILPILWSYTFDCSNLYYNHQTNEIQLITANVDIKWSDYEYKWSREWTEWNNSSTMKIYNSSNKKYIDLIEFQFHSKSRTNMAIRWHYENLIKFFGDKLDIKKI